MNKEKLLLSILEEARKLLDNLEEQQDFDQMGLPETPYLTLEEGEDQPLRDAIAAYDELNKTRPPRMIKCGKCGVDFNDLMDCGSQTGSDPADCLCSKCAPPLMRPGLSMHENPEVDY